MAETDLDITNRALQQMGSRTSIASFDEDSNEARAAKLIFTKAVSTILAEVDWNFARTTSPGLLIAVQALPPPWSYAYLYPEDGLEIRGITSATGRLVQTGLIGNPENLGGYNQSPAYSLGRLRAADGTAYRCVYTNLAGASLIYTAFVDDFDAWETLALDALELYIAMKLAIPLSGDKSLAQALAQQFDGLVLQARLRNANEDQAVQDLAPDWLLARDDCFDVPGGAGIGAGGSSGGGGGDSGGVGGVLSGSELIGAGNETLPQGTSI